MTTPKLSLSRMEGYCAKASDGPWEPYQCSFANEYGDKSDPEGCGLNGESFDCSYEECHHPLLLRDLIFIANARTDLPALLSWAKRARECLKELCCDECGIAVCEEGQKLLSECGE